MITILRLAAVHHWAALLRPRFPALTPSQVFGLALWSIGIVLARSASLHAVTLALAIWLNRNPDTLQKRLREWYLEADAKKGSGTGGTGQHRRDFDPHGTAPWLLRWLIEGWPNRQLVLVLDPTNFQDRFHVLAISVLYRRCAIPLTWTVVLGNQPDAWEPHWERMLGQLATLLPAGWQVLVLGDRGLYSPRLFRCLVKLGWHPFLRIHAQGYFRPENSDDWVDLAQLELSKNQAQAWGAEVFKNEEGRLRCTLLAYHGDGYEDPWLIVTDLSPQLAQARWYGLRGWVEQSYKRIKGEGWKLHRTRIRDCVRLERVWLAVAVATLWVLQVGGAAEAHDDGTEQDQQDPNRAAAATVPPLPDREPGRPREAKKRKGKPEGGRRRTWAVFARGWCLVRNTLALGVILLARWHPEAWPDHPATGLPPTRAATQTCQAARANPQTPPGAKSVNANHSCDSS